jgi:O-antigen/teichoic acid export membrane protein
MQKLRGYLVPIKCNVSRRSLVFNTTANALDAMQSLLLFVVVTRVCGVPEGGIFSIAMAVAYQMIVIGRYGMRDYQSTDIHKDFAFSTYFLSRLVTASCMFFWLAGYMLWKGYEPEKVSIVLAVAFYKSIDVIEDVYHGYYQREGRLDSASLAQTIRLSFTIFLYLTILVLTRNLLLATIISAVFSYLAFVLLNRTLRTVFAEPAFQHAHWPAVKQLLLKCAPLGICGFLQLYVVNYPKYAIDSFLTDTVQSYYGALSMPVFVINLLSISIYRPLLTQLASNWQTCNKSTLRQMLHKQFLFIAAITVMALIFGYLLGIPILSWIYGMNLEGYRPALMILLAGGGMAALAGFMTSVIAAMRVQQYLLIGYGVTMLLEIGLASLLVQKMGTVGASILFTTSMLVLALTTSGIVIRTMKKSGYPERNTL